MTLLSQVHTERENATQCHKKSPVTLAADIHIRHHLDKGPLHHERRMPLVRDKGNSGVKFIILQ